MKPKILYLTVSKLPFDVMVTGEKKQEFRKPSQWILSRLYNKEYDYVKITNGYSKDSPFFIARYLGWEYNSKEFAVVYTNGLRVDVEPFDYIIRIGEIITTNDLPF